jgi:hypothetical protein
MNARMPDWQERKEFLELIACQILVQYPHPLTFPSHITVAKIDVTPNLTTAVSILLVSVDNSQMYIYSSLKTQRNNRITQ